MSQLKNESSLGLDQMPPAESNILFLLLTCSSPGKVWGVRATFLMQGGCSPVREGSPPRRHDFCLGWWWFSGLEAPSSSHPTDQPASRQCQMFMHLRPLSLALTVCTAEEVLSCIWNSPLKTSPCLFTVPHHTQVEPSVCEVSEGSIGVQSCRSPQKDWSCERDLTRPCLAPGVALGLACWRPSATLAE